MDKTSSLHFREMGSIPGWGTKILHDAWYSPKKKMVTRAMDIKNRVSKGRKIGDTLDWCIRKASLGEGR